MSYIQLVARFENLRNAFDDTLAEIEARQYQGNNVFKVFFVTRQPLLYVIQCEIVLF